VVTADVVAKKLPSTNRQALSTMVGTIPKVAPVNRLADDDR
jgi:hypothetical protein